MDVENVISLCKSLPKDFLHTQVIYVHLVHTLKIFGILGFKEKIIILKILLEMKANREIFQGWLAHNVERFLVDTISLDWYMIYSTPLTIPKSLKQIYQSNWFLDNLETLSMTQRIQAAWIITKCVQSNQQSAKDSQHSCLEASRRLVRFAVFELCNLEAHNYNHI